MLSQIVLTNNKILKEHFEQLLGENHTVVAKWGFPVCEVEVTQETDVLKAIFTIVFNMMTSAYTLKTYSVKKTQLEQVEGDESDPVFEEAADWLNIDSGTIDFFINRIKEISEQFFTTREQPKVEEPATKELKKQLETEDEVEDTVSAEIEG